MDGVKALLPRGAWRRGPYPCLLECLEFEGMLKTAGVGRECPVTVWLDERSQLSHQPRNVSACREFGGESSNRLGVGAGGNRFTWICHGELSRMRSDEVVGAWRERRQADAHVTAGRAGEKQPSGQARRHAYSGSNTGRSWKGRWPLEEGWAQGRPVGWLGRTASRRARELGSWGAGGAMALAAQSRELAGDLAP